MYTSFFLFFFGNWEGYLRLSCILKKKVVHFNCNPLNKSFELTTQTGYQQMNTEIDGCPNLHSGIKRENISVALSNQFSQEDPI